MSLGSFINIFKANLQLNCFERLYDVQMLQKCSVVLIFTESIVLGRTANKKP